MKRLLLLVFATVAALPYSQAAQGQQREQYEKLVATHAKANLVPEALVHRVIVRESKYQPGLVGRGGTIGLMQIKLATARGLGYTGDAEGLRDPNTNLAYGVKYLAGAYRVANGDHDRAVHYYAAGYYEAAKQQRLQRLRHPVLASAPPKDVVKPQDTAKAEEVAATPGDAAAPKLTRLKPKQTAAKPKEPRKRLADAKSLVPRPPANIPAGANAAKPR